MPRNDFPEIGAIRYIKQNDIEKPFDNILKRKNKIGLPEVFDYNIGQRHSLIYDYNDNILAFLVVDEYHDHFYLNLIENNQLFWEECRCVNPAPKLIFFVEKVALSRDHSWIMLDSLKSTKLVAYYQTLGYSKVGDEIHPSYGYVIKMKKILN